VSVDCAIQGGVKGAEVWVVGGLIFKNKIKVTDKGKQKSIPWGRRSTFRQGEACGLDRFGESK